MAKFAVVNGGEIINMDHVVKISDISIPESRDAGITLIMVNGSTVTASGEQMEDIKRFVFRNSIAS